MDINAALSYVGPFVIYAGVLTLFVIVITYFMKIGRALAVGLFFLTTAYYLFLATPQEKAKMDAYAKSVYESIIGKNINITAIKNTISSEANAIYDKTKHGAEQGVKELAGERK